MLNPFNVGKEIRNGKIILVFRP